MAALEEDPEASIWFELTLSAFDLIGARFVRDLEPGEFLVMASTLMRIEARLLLPVSRPGEDDEDDIDPRDDSIIIDATPFIVRDAHGVAERLDAMNEGKFEVDDSRSAIYLPRTKAFPDNTEVEAIVTFTGDYFGAYTYRADLHWDGTHNLADVVVFAVGLGAACTIVGATRSMVQVSLSAALTLPAQSTRWKSAMISPAVSPSGTTVTSSSNR